MIVDPKKMLDMWLHGATQAEIGERFGIHQSTASTIIRRELGREFGTAPYRHRMQWQRDMLLEERRQKNSIKARVLRLFIA